MSRVCRGSAGAREVEHELASVIDTAADGEDDAHDGGIQIKGRKGEGRLLSGGVLTKGRRRADRAEVDDGDRKQGVDEAGP